MTEIKKCPFCNGEVEIYADSIYFVECKNCEIGTRIKATEPEAIAAWNKRAKDENTLTLDEIRAVLENYKNNAYCNSTSCKIFGNFVSCLECLMHELQKKARG